MKLLLTAARLRSVIDGVRTEKDLEISLRLHRIRFTWTTEPGYLAARVPLRSGPVLVYRTASRSAPFQIRSASPSSAPFPFPVRSAVPAGAPDHSAPRPIFAPLLRPVD